MSEVTTTVQARRRVSWRSAIVAIVAGLLGLFFMLLFYFINPFTGAVAPRPGYTPALHTWHEVEAAVVAGLYGATLLLLAWRPGRKPLLLQFFILAMLQHLLTVALFMGFSSDMAIYAVAILLLAALYPDRRPLLRLGEGGQLSRLLFALAILITVLVTPGFLRSLGNQLSGVGGEHLANGHYLETMGLAVMLALAAFLTATRGPGWRYLGSLTGLFLVILGAAALAVPASDGSMGIEGGAAAILAGIAFAAATLREASLRPGPQEVVA